MPTGIMRGIIDLTLSFQAGPTLAKADQARMLQLYGEALHGQNIWVAEFTLHRLRFKNPRNPWRPTPQDVFDECVKAKWMIVNKIYDHIINGQPWYGLEGGYPMPRCPEPFSPNCPIPQCAYMDSLRSLVSIQAGWVGTDRREAYLAMPDEKLDMLLNRGIMERELYDQLVTERNRRAVELADRIARQNQAAIRKSL